MSTTEQTMLEGKQKWPQKVWLDIRRFQSLSIKFDIDPTKHNYQKKGIVGGGLGGGRLCVIFHFMLWPIENESSVPTPKSKK